MGSLPAAARAATAASSNPTVRSRAAMKAGTSAGASLAASSPPECAKPPVGIPRPASKSPNIGTSRYRWASGSSVTGCEAIASPSILREPAAGWLQPDQAVDRRGDPDRAAAVVGVRERDGAGGDQCCRRRPTRHRRCGRSTRETAPAPTVDARREALNPYSESWVLPSGTTPVARNIRAKSPSRLAGSGAKASVPCIVGRPARSELSLTKVGIPAKKPPRGAPPRRARVEALGSDGVQLGGHPLGAGDRRIDHLGDRDAGRCGSPRRARPRRGPRARRRRRRGCEPCAGGYPLHRPDST